MLSYPDNLFEDYLFPIPDPIDAMVKQNLTLIWESFKGTIESEISRNKTRSTYGEELCWNDLAHGHVNPKINCKDEPM